MKNILFKSKLLKLREKAKQLEEFQNNCTHVWSEPKIDVNKQQFWAIQCIDIDLFPSGSGIFGEITCWSHTCKICGKKEFFDDLELEKNKTLSLSKTNNNDDNKT